MISSFISRYMIDQVLNPSVPKIKGKCLDSLQGRKKCGKCIELCPEKALSFEEDIHIDKNKCSNCNICSAICPSGCIVPTYEVVEKQYNAFNNNDEIVIGCSKSEGNSNLNVECLASIPWEALAYATMDKKIKILSASCEECKYKELSCEFENAKLKLKQFLGEKKYKDKFMIIHGDDEVNVKEYSRRDLLKLWGYESRRIANLAVPIKVDQSKNARIYKSLLLKKIADNKEQKFAWPILKVSDKCWGCQVCSKVCPQQAITINKAEEGKKKFIHDFTKCTQCEICKVVCNEKAVEFVNKDISIKEKVEYEIKGVTCSVCGCPIKGDNPDKCSTCK